MADEPAPRVAGSEDEDATVSDPAELVRLGTMLQTLMSEVHEMELDEAARQRLFDVHRGAVDALKAVISDDLEHELEQLGLPIERGDASAAELRMAQAQLIGWLNGLFQGIQAAVMAQQLGAAQQLKQLQQQRPELGDGRVTGQYL